MHLEIITDDTYRKQRFQQQLKTGTVFLDLTAAYDTISGYTREVVQIYGTLVCPIG